MSILLDTGFQGGAVTGCGSMACMQSTASVLLYLYDVLLVLLACLQATGKQAFAFQHVCSLQRCLAMQAVCTEIRHLAEQLTLCNPDKIQSAH